MKKQNIGTVSAFIRLSTGLCGLAVGTSRLSRRHTWQMSDLLIVKLSAVKVAEGITKYCPTKELFDSQGIFQKESQTAENLVDQVN